MGIVETGGRLPAPKSAELINASDLNDSERHTVQINSVPGTGPLPVPPYSLMRIIWSGEISIRGQAP